MRLRETVAKNLRRLRQAKGLSQEELADLMGITPVHVKRTMMALRDDGLVQLRHKGLEIRDFDLLGQLVPSGAVIFYKWSAEAQ